MTKQTSSIAVVCLIALGACGERADRSTTRDALGRSVAIPSRIERVVTLAPNVTEILFAIGAGAKVVATDDFSNYPAAARRVAKVGGMQPNVEKIVTLRPDLVIASTEGNHPNLATALSAAGIPLYVVRTDRLAEVAPAMRQLGAILAAPGADVAAARLDAGIAKQRRTRATSARLLFAVWTDPLYVAGTSTFTDDLFALTGARNAVTRGGWPQYPLELVVASPPDLILYPRGAVTPAQMDAFMARLPGLKARVVEVDEDVFQRPGPRLVDAAARLNAILDSAR